MIGVLNMEDSMYLVQVELAGPLVYIYTLHLAG